MFDTREYKTIRLSKTAGQEISPAAYNLIIGAALLFGIGIDMMMAIYMQEPILHMSLLAVILIYFAGSLLCTAIIYHSDSPVISFLGFTGLSVCMGLLITFAVSSYTAGTVAYAFGMTGLVTVLMMLLAAVFPRFFLGLGRTLFLSLLAAIAVELIFRLLLGFAMNFMDYLVALLFAGFIGYDWSRAQAYPKTVDNAIDSAADIFVDIIGLFLRILSITGERN
ncbi:MAG: Bax inhibitor-1 family protein [Eubacteriales bacterium]|jgi:FtsH-binding integral membrane protein|nr:Bax inhibitor-1 family protein [Eubacteriales bacterium]